jgi:hypothetical protein
MKSADLISYVGKYMQVKYRPSPCGGRKGPCDVMSAVTRKELARAFPRRNAPRRLQLARRDDSSAFYPRRPGVWRMSRLSSRLECETRCRRTLLRAEFRGGEERSRRNGRRDERRDSSSRIVLKLSDPPKFRLIDTYV